MLLFCVVLVCQFSQYFGYMLFQLYFVVGVYFFVVVGIFFVQEGCVGWLCDKKELQFDKLVEEKKEEK